MERVKSLICERCEYQVFEGDDFCIHCGNLVNQNIPCNHHTDYAASGVCIICAEPFCSQCGLWVNNHFLCLLHSDYEIHEGMVRVYGIPDYGQAQYVADVLTNSGLHPFVFSRRGNPMLAGNLKSSVIKPSNNFTGKSLYEFKVMVPSQEVLEAEKALWNLDIKHDRNQNGEIYE